MHADATQRERPACYRIEAHKDPQTLLRILNHFAQLGLVPSLVDVAEAPDRLKLRIVQKGLDEKRARIIAEKINSAVLVLAAELTFAQEGGIDGD